MQVQYKIIQGSKRYNHRVTCFAGYTVEGIFLPIRKCESWRQNAHNNRPLPTIESLVGNITDDAVIHKAMQMLTLTPEQVSSIFTKRYRHKQARNRDQAIRLTSEIVEEFSNKERTSLEWSYILTLTALANYDPRDQNTRITDPWKVSKVYNAICEAL